MSTQQQPTQQPNIPQALRTLFENQQMLRGEIGALAGRMTEHGAGVDATLTAILDRMGATDNAIAALSERIARMERDTAATDAPARGYDAATRRRALNMLRRGKTIAEVAGLIGCDRGTLRRWRDTEGEQMNQIDRLVAAWDAAAADTYSHLNRAIRWLLVLGFLVLLAIWTFTIPQFSFLQPIVWLIGLIAFIVPFHLAQEVKLGNIRIRHLQLIDAQLYRAITAEEADDEPQGDGITVETAVRRVVEDGALGLSAWYAETGRTPDRPLTKTEYENFSRALKVVGVIQSNGTAKPVVTPGMTTEKALQLWYRYGAPIYRTLPQDAVLTFQQEVNIILKLDNTVVLNKQTTFTIESKARQQG